VFHKYVASIRFRIRYWRAKLSDTLQTKDQSLYGMVLSSLDDDKAEDIIAIDLAGKTAIADHMFVASGRSQRHVGAVADHLLRKIKGMGIKDVRVEGLNSCDWVLVDAGDIIVHIFRPEVRAFYGIEKMWAADFSSESAASAGAQG